MLENQGQGVLFLLEQDFESVLGIKFLTGLEPGEGWFFAGCDLTLTAFEQSKDILSVWNNV